MNRRRGGLRAVLMLWGALAAALGGCQSREQTKTLVLPSLEDQTMDLEKLRISSIREYVGSGREEDRMCLEWGEQGNLLYLVRMEGENCLYETVDTRTGEVVSSVRLDDRGKSMGNVSVAPGGKCVCYEMEDGEGMELAAFFPEKGIRVTLHAWEDSEETFSYVWSDDGKRLFSWQNGDTKDPYADWSVTGYDLTGAAVVEGDSHFHGQKWEFALKGQGRSWRIVLPDAEGTEIYVREQFRTFNGFQDDEGEAGGMTVPEASNWLLLPDTATMTKLQDYSQDSVYPVKYTAAGLFYQDADGTLRLVEDIRSGLPAGKVLIPGDSERYAPIPCICENGDHIFLVEWLEPSVYQISGIRISDGEVDGEPVVLYRDNYDSLVRIAVRSDRVVTFWGRETPEEERYHYKVTVLEYWP